MGHFLLGRENLSAAVWRETDGGLVSHLHVGGVPPASDKDEGRHDVTHVWRVGKAFFNRRHPSGPVFARTGRFSVEKFSPDGTDLPCLRETILMERYKSRTPPVDKPQA